MSDFSRRQFVFVAATATAASLLDSPCVLAATPPKPLPVDAGLFSGYSKDGITTRFAQRKFLIIRKDKRLYAVTTTCTHKSSTLAVPKPDAQQIRCPKHDSVFNLDGTVAGGPAKQPLPRHAIKLNEQKHVIVDTSQRFEESDWDDPAAFIKVE